MVFGGSKNSNRIDRTLIKRSFREKPIQFFSHLISIDCYILGLMSINMNIIPWWRQLISIKSNIILISINCYSIDGLISIKSNIIWWWWRLISIKSNII